MAIIRLDVFERPVRGAFELAALPSVWVAGVIGLVGLVLLAALTRWRSTGPLPSFLLWLPAVLAGRLADDGGINGGWDEVRATGGGLLMVMLTAAVIGGAGTGTDRWVPAPRSLARRGRTTHVLITIVGIALCVPETSRIAIAIGPALLTVLAVRMKAVAPLNRGEIALVVGLLAWIGLVDGSTRPSAVLGAAACIAAIGLLAPTGTPSDRRIRSLPTRALRSPPVAWRQGNALVVYLLTILACSRLAGIDPSTRFAALVATAALTFGTALSWALLRSGPDGPTMGEAAAGAEDRHRAGEAVPKSQIE